MVFPDGWVTLVGLRPSLARGVPPRSDSQVCGNRFVAAKPRLRAAQPRPAGTSHPGKAVPIPGIRHRFRFSPPGFPAFPGAVSFDFETAPSAGGPTPRSGSGMPAGTSCRCGWRTWTSARRRPSSRPSAAGRPRHLRLRPAGPVDDRSGGQRPRTTLRLADGPGVAGVAARAGGRAECRHRGVRRSRREVLSSSRSTRRS